MMLNLEMAMDSPRYKHIRRKLESLIKLSESRMNDLHTTWKTAEDKFYAYLPEKDVDAIRRGKRDLEGKPQYVTIIIPYSYAMLMTAHTYWTSVFFARDPVFQFMARHGETKLNEMAIETLVDYQRTVGRFLVPLYIWLLDVGRYGVGIIGNYWANEYSYVASIKEEEDLFLGVIPVGKKKKNKVVERITGYEGNKLYNVRPYDWYPDPRVPIHRFQDGSFEARYVEIPWEEIISTREDNGYFNLEDLRKKKFSEQWRQRDYGSTKPIRPWSDPYGGENEKDPPSVVPAYEITIKVIPQDWMLGGFERVEKWIFTMTSDFSIIFGARPLGCYHDKFPKAILQMEPDGYNLSSRGIVEILGEMQNTLDWLINTHFYNVRKTLNNQFVVDPSRIHMPDVLDPRAGGIWRVKPDGYGQDVGKMIYQVPTVDITRTHMQDAGMITEMMQRVMGITDGIMGVSPRGGRKTAQEVRVTTQSSMSRLKTQAEFFSELGFSPLAQMIVQNTQQYYDAEKAFKIAGNMLTPGVGPFLKIKPDDIAGFYDYVPIDGTLPVDRFAQAQLYRQMIMDLAQMPALLAQYDLGGLFAWTAQLAGLKNVNQFKFKTQLTPDEQIMYQLNAGNIVGQKAIGGDYGGAGNTNDGAGTSGSLGRVPEPGQLPGMGQTG